MNETKQRRKRRSREQRDERTSTPSVGTAVIESESQGSEDLDEVRPEARARDRAQGDVEREGAEPGEGVRRGTELARISERR